MAIPTQLAGLDGNLLPREVVGPIFDSAQEQSVFMRLGQRIPVGFGDTAIPTVTQRPEAGVVGAQSATAYDGEGKAKPVSGYEYDVTTIRPIKLATIVVVSEEFKRSNPNGFYDQISGDLSYAVSRAVDLAVGYGKSANNNADIAGATYFDQTTNSVALGTATTDNGGLYQDFLSAATLVGNAGSMGYDVTAIAADPRLRFTMLAQVDPFGRPVLQTGNTPNLNNQVDNIMGIPVFYGRSISGRSSSNPAGTDNRAFLGDFQGQFRWGTALDMTLRASNEAVVSTADGTQLNLWQNNLTALLVEMVFGWAIGDLNAFAKLTQAPASTGTTTA